MAVRIGSRTIQLNHAPSIVGFAAVGAKEGKGRAAGRLLRLSVGGFLLRRKNLGKGGNADAEKGNRACFAKRRHPKGTD